MNIAEEDERPKSPFTPGLPPWIDWSQVADPSSLTEEQLREIIVQAFLKIKQIFAHYETRDHQVEMSVQTLCSFYFEKTAIIEAGTGIGKSFAYLVAVLAFSHLRGKRILVITETKNLQIQIFEKDLRLIQKALDPLLNFALCLGSNNYLCKLRYEEIYREGSFQNIIDDKKADAFREWADDVFEQGNEGNLFEAPDFVRYPFWSLVNRNSDGCPARKCDYYYECNYFKTRNQWQQNRILVGNHHLLLLHLQNEKKLLPEYGGVVVDEAHSFLDAAYSIFSLGFRINSLSDYRSNIEKTIFAKASKEVKEQLEKMWESSEKLWNIFFSFWQNHLNLSLAGNKNKIISSKPEIETNELKKSITELQNILSEEFSEEAESILLNDYASVNKFLSRLTRFLNAFADMNFEKNVYWANVEGGVFSLQTCFIEIGDQLNELFMEPQLWTSATLGYWGGGTPPSDKYKIIEAGYFDGFKKNILPVSVGSEDLVEDIFKSRFPYREKTVIYTPKELIAPQWGAEPDKIDAYEESLLQEIAYLINLAKGGALVLFTSYYLLNKMTHALSERVDQTIYSQADFGAHKALELFKKDTSSVLLGTNSFWQGVDIPGEGLRMLIITRLMFQPPDDPIFKARAEKIKERNGNHFIELALPYSSTMLRQGFGRLIRNESDSGVVAILDSRIVQKSYGKTLRINLPKTEVAFERAELEKLIEEKNLISIT